MNVKLNVLSHEALLAKYGLQEGGPVQKLVDREVMRSMVDHMMILSTVIGSGQIDIPGPYAHYLHEGILYVSPTTGSSWAKKDEIKVPTDRLLTYAGAPMRGKKFFDRMKADHKDDILKDAQALVDRGGKT